MRYYQFCPEARRNPEQNPRKSGHSAAVEYLEKVGDLSHVGIRMTDMPKLGLNPMSDYNTPLGICFYPAEYYMQIKKNDRYLPFQEEAKYIQIFKWDSDKVLNIDEVTESQATQDILPKLAKIYNPSEVKELWNDSSHSSTVDSPGGRIWNVMWRLTGASEYLRNAGRDWGHLLRKLGYDIVLDIGRGIIHKSEPTQGIVLNPRIITHMDQIQQTYIQSKNIGRQTSVKSKIWHNIHSGNRMTGGLLAQVARNPDYAYEYATKVLKGRFPEGEAAIATDPDLTYNYIVNILDGPFPAAEDTIAKDSTRAYFYAKDILKDPDPKTWAQRHLAGH
jgi:hypothetical protein